MLAMRRSPRIVTLICAALFIAISAVPFRLPGLFYMVGVLLAAPLVSYLLAAGGLRAVRAERRVAPRLWPGERTEVELRISNLSRWPKALLLIDEELPDGLTGLPEEPPSCVVPMLWGEPFVYAYPLLAQHRGRYQLPPVRATAVDAFDLFAASRPVGPPDEVIVYPRTVPLEADMLAGARLLARVADQHRADGTDFRHTREYLPGDDLRRIHWPSTARRGTPIVVEYEEPTSSNLFIVLDASPQFVVGAGRETSFETAVTLAASLIRYELEHGHAVGLFVDLDPPIHVPLTDDRQSLIAFFEELAVIEPTSPRRFDRSLLAAAEVAPSNALLFAIGSGPGSDARAAGDGAVPAAGLLAAAGELGRRKVPLAYAYVDPSGFDDPAAAPPALSFLHSLRLSGAQTLLLDRTNLAASLRTWR